MHSGFEANRVAGEKCQKDNAFGNSGSRECVGKNSSLASVISNENVSSSAIFDGNSKNVENSVQSSDAKPMIYSGEDDAVQRTESSCSSSYFAPPVCSSNENYLESSAVQTGVGCRVEKLQNRTNISIEAKGDNQGSDKQENCCSLYSKEDSHPAEVNGIRNKASVKNELVNGFDLNDDHEQSLCEAVSHFRVIRVMAKLGVPLSSPNLGQKFRGELGWRGRAATSAFRPTSITKRTDGSSRDSRGSTLIDLNLTAEEDCAAIEFRFENEKSPDVSRAKDTSLDYGSGSKQKEKFILDLNAPGDNADDCTRSFFPVNLTESASMGLNSNGYPSVGEAARDDQIQHQRSQTSGTKIPEHPKDHLSILGHVFNNGRGQQFLVAAPPNLLQPMDRVHQFVPVQPQLSPYTMQVLPPQHYPPNAPFFITHNNLCYGTLPYTRGPIPHVPVPPYPSFDTDIRTRYGVSGHNTESNFLQPRKRIEPESGWDGYQLGLRLKPSSH